MRIPITHSDKLYNIVAIIRAVNADSVFPLPLLPFFPLLLDLLALRTPLQELNNYSHGCYSEHNLPSSHIGFYCFSTYSAEKISCVRVNSFHLCVLVKLLYFTRMSIHPYFLYTLLFPAHFIQFDAARLVKMRFIHLHPVKNCGSFCGASIQEPGNCRPLDAQ